MIGKVCRLSLVSLAVSVILPFVVPVFATDEDAGIDFFEKKIRPVLVEHCYECHSGDAKSLKGGLLLEYREQLLKGGDSGPAIIDRKPADSLLMESLRWEGLEMPPSGKLPQRVIQDFQKWIQMGAPWPSSRKTPLIDSSKTYNWKDLQQAHWAFRPVRKPEPPQVAAEDWVRNGIDRFVLARLDAAGLAPAPSATGIDLVRRIYFDLVGLPPGPEQVARFSEIYSNDPDRAVRELVDQLLESSQYGERWGRHWLDVARYSDGFGGFNDNAAMNDAWRYRDWVVSSLNRDLPFEDFILLQIAGDLVTEKKSPVATGFLALGPTYRSDGGDPDSVSQAKSETLDDRIDTLSRGLMGITASCSRCHDHKFDPIPQLDYYSLAGVFNNTAVHQVPLASQEEVDRYNDHQKKIQEANKQLQQLNNGIKKEKRSPNEKEKSQQTQLQQQLDQLRKNAPQKYDTAHALRDSGSGNMKVAIRGNLRKTGEEAPRRFLRILAGEHPPLFTGGSGRLELARAIVDSANPLTYRVFVNRIWQHHIGRAIVRTPSNFGKLGESPTHPQLLDWLASQLLESGSIKQLHRLILNSSTYRMSTRYNGESFLKDGDNRLLWRMNPRRLDVEAWRDALLAVSGELDPTMGGPPSEDINMKRRTLYFKVSRGGDRFRSDELLRMFDFPLMRATVAQRPVSIVPQQYLFMLNSQFMGDRARALAGRLKAGADSDGTRIEQAYQLLFARKPLADEKELGLKFVGQKSTGKVDHWEKYCQVLLSSNEFLYLQ
ncbi:MAG: PSD1 and planctomycete cytochrome C domain-containing protein [Planctomycetota bacterium]|nr:PSD1 and planctomycete cytochrome C domain-containing protein [Planctomycetota bacterium]